LGERQHQEHERRQSEKKEDELSGTFLQKVDDGTVREQNRLSAPTASGGEQFERAALPEARLSIRCHENGF
jgi:hypothetical protein